LVGNTPVLVSAAVPKPPVPRPPVRNGFVERVAFPKGFPNPKGVAAAKAAFTPAEAIPCVKLFANVGFEISGFTLKPDWNGFWSGGATRKPFAWYGLLIVGPAN
jgi:hypothetical protein